MEGTTIGHSSPPSQTLEQWRERGHYRIFFDSRTINHHRDGSDESYTAPTKSHETTGIADDVTALTSNPEHPQACHGQTGYYETYSKDLHADLGRLGRANRYSLAADHTRGTSADASTRFVAFSVSGLAILAPLARALESHWPYFVAGGICAAISHTAAVPLDVVKTRIQCAEPGKYGGTWDALVRIWRSEGGQVLFCGAGATLVGYAMQGCLKFGFFEYLKPSFAKVFVGGAASGGSVLGSLIAASMTAEVVGSSVLTPLEAARIRMVTDSKYAGSLREGLLRMIAEEGLGALVRGLPALLAKQLPYTVTKLVTFDALMRGATSRARGNVTRLTTAACAVAAGVLSSVASQPGDALLSMLNNDSRPVASYEQKDPSMRESARPHLLELARRAGISGLFKGMRARMLHVTAIVTVQLLIYQSVKQMVGIKS